MNKRDHDNFRKAVQWQGLFHRFQPGKSFRVWIFLFAFGLAAVREASALTPVPTAASAAPAATAAEAPLSPQEEIQVLDAIDGNSNTASASATQQAPAAASLGPPPAPAGVKLLALKEGVYLSWDAAPAGSPVASYNVYRSTTPGEGYRLINLKPLAAPYFLDGAENSLTPPKNKEDYFYVVAAVSSRGEVSPYSDESAITPEGMEIPLTAEEQKEAEKPTPVPTQEEEKVLNVPEQKIVNLQLPADTQLSIQGYKKIAAVFSFQHYNRPDLNGIKPDVNNTQVNQELVVNLQGKVGKNVDVNVDYSDVNRNDGTNAGVDQSKQNISIVYHGNEDSPIQEVAFGDLQLYLPNTEFAGFSKQLFGLQAKVKLDRFRFTSFFAQTKGISETKVFKGNYVQVRKDIQDIDYLRFRYFLISRSPYLLSAGPPAQLSVTVVNPAALPQNNSEQIWVDPGNGQLPPTGNPNFIGYYEHWLPGRDYTIDYTTGVISFLRSLTAYSKVVAAYVTKGSPGQASVSIGFTAGGQIDLDSAGLHVDPNGILSDSAHLLNDNANPAAVSPYYLLGYFDLGRDKIIPPQQDPDFLFQVIDQGTNNTLQTGTNGPWNFNVDLDLNILTLVNTSAAFDAPPLFFPDRPFANNDVSGGTASNDVYSQTTPPTSSKRIHLEYKTKLDFFRLDRFNIIRGSESVYLDGRRLRRDVDYFFDYTSGFLDFQDKSLLRPDSQIVVTYEYAPFGSFGQSNILGARAEYDLTDNFFLGSTFLYTTTQQPSEVPQIGSAPNSLAVIDADAKYDISSEEIQSFTGIIPGLENWKPPLNIKLSGEIAQSYFSPDTFNAEGENGVAMVDNMEGIDNTTGPSLGDSRSWLVSSAPQPVPGFLGALVPNAGPVTSLNNRVRFTNEFSGDDFGVISQALNSGVPGVGGHVYSQESSPNPNDAVAVMRFPFSHLTNQRWAGVRQILSTTGVDLSNTRYFQTWVYGDGSDKWVMFDFGIINEDSNGNGSYDHDPNVGTSSLAVTDYGIPTFYAPNTPWIFPAGGAASYQQDANGAQGYIGNPVTLGSPTQEGKFVGANTNYVTEDLNGDNQLQGTDAYFEYGVRANWTGWRQVKIPVNFSASDGADSTSDGLSYFFHSVPTTYPLIGSPNPQVVKTVRIWTTGTSASEISGSFLVENISFARNQWQLAVDPDANINQGVTVNSSKFDVNSISSEQDSRYNSTLRFLTVTSGQDQSAIQAKEKSLKITYNLSSADFEPSGNVNGKPIYYATRLYSQGLDFTDYQELRFDLQVKSFQPGEVLFIRLSNDQKNYYQFNIPLTGGYQNNWNTVIIPLDGSHGNRSKVGTPFINRTSQISFGVVSPNGPSAQTGELWINNLRTVSSAERSGLARRLNAAFNLGDNFATINTRYREVDSGFTQMDQTSTHFQHSRQIGADYSSNAVKLFAQPLVTEFHLTQQNTYTEDALKQNPYYLALPDTRIDNATGSIGYTKDLGPEVGRLTSVRLSGSTNYETDTYLPDYLSQPGVQGNNRKGQENLILASTYDAPAKLFFIPIGTNQLNQSYSLTHDTQTFDNGIYSPYERTTRVQSYGWTNTTELVKNLVFTPGYTLSLTDAVGNTTSPGVAGAVPVPNYVPFQQRYQPKLGVVFRGLSGITPGVDYSGSNQLDYASFPDGTRFNSANTLNYSLNLSPGNWIPLLQKINLTVFGGRTETASEAIPGYGTGPALKFDEQWLTNPNFDPATSLALTGTKSVAHQLNASFKLFDVWDFRPTGSWNDQLSLLSKGSNPVKQNGRTLGLTTIYNRRIFTVPFINFNLNSAQLQYTRTENNQYDSSGQQNIDTASDSDLYSATFPYDINQKAQGNIRLQRTQGNLNTRGTLTTQLDDQGSIEYNQKFAPNLEIHIPFTHWKLKLQDAIELRATYLMEFVRNDSLYVYNQIRTERFRGTLDFNYNALKNLRVGLGVAYENFTNDLNSQLSYTLWQGTISVEARF